MRAVERSQSQKCLCWLKGEELEDSSLVVKNGRAWGLERGMAQSGKDEDVGLTLEHM